MTPENSSPAQEHLERVGVRFGRDLILESSQKPYINAAIFLDYIRTVFSPCLVSLRDLAIFAEEVAVLLWRSVRFMSLMM
jgi:hypothetical protein